MLPLLRFFLLRSLQNYGALIAAAFVLPAYIGYSIEKSNVPSAWVLLWSIAYICFGIVAIFGALAGGLTVSNELVSLQEFDFSRPITREQAFDASVALTFVISNLVFLFVVLGYFVGQGLRGRAGMAADGFAFWSNVIDILPLWTLILSTGTLCSMQNFLSSRSKQSFPMKVRTTCLFGLVGICYFVLGIVLMTQVSDMDTVPWWNFASLAILLLPVFLYFMVRDYVQRGLLLP